MKYIIGLVAMLLPFLSGAQSPPAKGLSIGDTVPDITINNILNYKTTSAKLSDFKGKLIILDFWSSWCSSCLALFPHMDSMQRNYKKDLQVILVNTKSKQYKDDGPKITKILNRIKESTGSTIDLPVVYDCPQLDGYFPCIEIPHEVWINGEGKVVGITYPDQVIPENIHSLINGNEVHMRLKKDRFDVDLRMPLFVNGNGGDGAETLFRSLVTGYIDGAGGGTGRLVSNEKFKGLYSINQSLFSLTKTAYKYDIPFPDNRIILEVKEGEKFRARDSDTASYHYKYSYEIMVHPTTSDSGIIKLMKNDLKRYFNISVKREIRKIECLVLTSLSASPSKVAVNKTGFDLERSTPKKYIYNYPSGGVAHILNLFSSIPVINEIKATECISVDLPFNINNVKKLQDALAKAGISLKVEYRDMEVVVITDK
jgi:thiol-disulfide isomerase/thioredoxin